MSDSNANKPSVTIWLWPTGLFPRRIIYLLAAKKIAAATLAAHSINLIPVVLDPNSYILESRPGYEARPEGSLPVMRIRSPRHGNDNEGREKEEEVWIHESLGIMTYLEDVFSPSNGYPDLRGSNPIQRAKTADILSNLSDASIWSVVSVIHSNQNMCSWSGLEKEEMSSTAAEHGQKKLDTVLGKLEKWVEWDVNGEKSKSLSGEGVSVTMADVVLMAQVEYIKAMYGTLWIEEYEVLKEWWERTRTADWVVRGEKLDQVEKTEKWEVLFG